MEEHVAETEAPKKSRLMSVRHSRPYNRAIEDVKSKSVGGH